MRNWKRIGFIKIAYSALFNAIALLITIQLSSPSDDRSKFVIILAIFGIVGFVISSGLQQFQDDHRVKSEVDRQVMEVKRQARIDHRKHTNLALRQLLALIARYVAPSAESTRAYVYIENPNSGEMKVFSATSGLDDDEFELGYRIRQGLVGQVWNQPERNDTTILDLFTTKPEELRGRWGFSQNQIDIITRKKRAFIAAPIFSSTNNDQPRKLIAILVIDSTKTSDASGFNLEHVKQNILEDARLRLGLFI